MAVSIVVLLCTTELTIIIICANAFIFFLKESSVGTETAVSAEITEITESNALKALNALDTCNRSFPLSQGRS